MGMDFNDKKDRNDLQLRFKKNSIPTESDFADLIKGMANYKEDGLLKKSGGPLMIQADQNAVELYKSADTSTPKWSLSLSQKEDSKQGLCIEKYDNGSVEKILFIDETTGNIGIGTAVPTVRLHIDAKDSCVFIDNGGLVVNGSGNFYGIAISKSFYVSQEAEVTIPQENWQRIDLYSGFVNFKDINPAQFLKDSFGFVHIRGILQRSRSSRGPMNTFICHLPERYRPLCDENHTVVSFGINNDQYDSAAISIGCIRIYADGKMEVKSGDSGWISLDGITFMTKK